MPFLFSSLQGEYFPIFSVCFDYHKICNCSCSPNHHFYRYCVGTVVALLLNAVLPEDAEVEMTEKKVDGPESFKDDEVDEA